MSTLSLRIPNSLHEQIRQLAKREGISINQFVASAAAEKMAALLTEEFIEARSKRASLKKFEKVLKKIPGMDVPDEVVKRMADTPKEKQAEEGIKICIESIQRLKAVEGVSGFHIMAIEWEEKVPEIVEAAGLHPRPMVDWVRGGFETAANVSRVFSFRQHLEPRIYSQDAHG